MLIRTSRVFTPFSLCDMELLHRSQNMETKDCTCYCRCNRIIHHCLKTLSHIRKALCFLVIISITSAMISPAEAVPLRVPEHQNATDPFWWNPCSVKYPAAPQHERRHSLFRSIGPLKTQMKTMMTHFRTVKITSKYCNTDPVSERQFTQSWLPVNPFEKYYRELAGKARHEKLTKLLPRLHEGLQSYALTFENLNLAVGDNIETAAFDVNERQKILVDIMEQTRALLCEVETSSNESKVPLPPRLHREAFDQNLDWNYEPNYTELCVQDRGVMLAYESFLAGWQRVLNNIGRAKGGKTIKTQQKRRAERKKSRRHRRRFQRLHLN